MPRSYRLPVHVEASTQMGTEIETEQVRAIERAIGGSLALRGIDGKIVLGDDVVCLYALDGTMHSVPIDWIGQWNLLPPDMQKRRADKAAEWLHTAINKRSADRVGGGIDPGALAKKGLVALLIVGVGLAGVRWLDRSGFFGRKHDSEADVTETLSNQKRLPQMGDPNDGVARACNAARRRIYAGAAMGVDIEGWAVELWLARASDGPVLMTDPTVRDAIRDATDLIPERSADASATIEPGAGASADAVLGVQSVRLRMTGAFVSTFFDTGGRKRMLLFSERVAKTSDAKYAALFARCQHLAIRDVGAWYRGEGRIEAFVSLMYASGAFVDPPAFTLEKVGEADRGKLAMLARLFSKRALAPFEAILRQTGGRIEPMTGKRSAPTSKAEGATAITFPIGAPTRAAVASRKLAKALALP